MGFFGKKKEEEKVEPIKCHYCDNPQTVMLKRMIWLEIEGEFILVRVPTCHDCYKTHKDDDPAKNPTVLKEREIAARS